MGLPQILLIALFALSLGTNLAHHGKERKGKDNVIYAMLSTLIIFSLLYWGGFFR
jgi:hypothetical protein